jgi:hydrogenase nickel incorporation protein HypA/HybF
MHELSLAHELLKKLCSLAKQHNTDRILEVNVAIGPLSGIVADSFRFGFEAMAQANSVTRGAVLVIDSPLPSYIAVISSSLKRHIQAVVSGATGLISYCAAATSCSCCRLK